MIQIRNPRPKGLVLDRGIQPLALWREQNSIYLFVIFFLFDHISEEGEYWTWENADEHILECILINTLASSFLYGVP